MTKAKIVGEPHYSLKRTEELRRLVESKNYDAIFLEGREDRTSNMIDTGKRLGCPFGYPFFVMGLGEWMVLLRIYSSKKSVLSSAKRLGIPVFTTIDAPIPMIFNMSNTWLRRILPPLFVFLSLFLIFHCWLVCGLVMLIMSPLLYLSILIQSVNEKRNEFMTDYIIEKIKTNNYSNILVSCGALHIDGIARRLKERGIQVET